MKNKKNKNEKQIEYMWARLMQKAKKIKIKTIFVG